MIEDVPYYIKGRDFSYLRIAVKQAERASYEKHRHGAVLTLGGVIISTGFNKGKTNPLPIRIDPKTERLTLHAETDCVYGFKAEDIKGASLYVVRLNRRGDLVNSRPCENCLLFLSKYSLNKIVFSNKDGGFSALM